MSQKNEISDSAKTSKAYIYSARFIFSFQSIATILLVFFAMFKPIDEIQIWIHQKQGEVLFGGRLASILGMFLGACIAYWILFLLVYIEKKFLLDLLKSYH